MKEMLGPGYGVRILGRTGLEYREGDQTVLIDGELLLGEYAFYIEAQTIYEWEGSKIPIDEEKREEIISAIIAAFAQCNERVLVLR